jgi:hypothetical protein
MNVRLGVLALTVLVLTGCATMGTRPTGPVVEKVLATGRSLVGNKPDAKVTVNGREFTLDCIGTVSAAWWGAGVDVQRDFRQYKGDGVNRLYESLRSWGALSWMHTPSPGDIIIWDNTWDVAGDPNYPDGHTHAGIVLSVDADGRVEYLHESVTRGVTTAYLNLYEPDVGLRDGKVVNSPMYIGSNFNKKDNPPRWTSGQLWSAFGDGYVVARTVGPES